MLVSSFHRFVVCIVLIAIAFHLSLVAGATTTPSVPQHQQSGSEIHGRNTEEIDGARLLQLLQHSPALTDLMKNYLAEQIRAAGVSVSKEQITTAMLYDRIQCDPQFAKSAAEWLLALTAEVSSTFQGLPGQQPRSAQGATSAAAPERAPQLNPAAKGSVSVARSDAAVVASTESQAQGPLRAPTTLYPKSTTAVASPQTKTPVISENSDLQVKSLPKYLLQDQQAFWTLPVHVHTEDLFFVVPASFATAALIGSDTYIEGHLPSSTTLVNRAADFSTAGALGFVGLGGGLYLWGRNTHDERKRETGFLMGEAMIDAYAASTAIQYMTQRERPFNGNGKGSFFYGGHSFPSNTAAASWAAASVLSHEYPGFLTKLLAYGMASGVSAGRVIGEKHWTSDAVIGSALGWYMGRQVYRARKQGAEINASTWGTFEKSPEQVERNPGFMGTTFVPLDSWIYPAMDRLHALGFLPTMVQQIKPWARMECARLTLEAQSRAADSVDTNPVVKSTIEALLREFAIEIGNLEGAPNTGAELESAYFRMESISGRPLYDSWHFAQTLYNDFGRPYSEGLNTVAGISGRAEAGPLAFYVRGEYQHAAGMPNYSPELAQTIASYDPLPANSVATFNTANRVRLLDAYVALNVANWEFTAGLQSLWWGPDYGTSLMMSNNAQPMPMLRVGRITPLRIPWDPLAWIQIKNTFFIGSLKGYTYLRGSYPNFPLIGNGYQLINPQPYTWGDKFVLKPSPNLEFGLGVGVIWAGYTRPATIDTWLHTWSLGGNTQSVEPGKRYTGASAWYRIPGLRDWLVLYADGLANDEPNPISYARQSAWNPGIYLPKLPLITNMDLRVEGVYTNVPNYPGLAPYYNNIHYALGYRNENQIIGSWVGRQGSAVQAWSTYWFSPQKKIQLGYRRQWNDPVFEQGGGLTDFSGTVDWLFKKSVQISALAQYERWNFPELKPWAGSMPQNNFTLGFQMSFWPLHGLASQPSLFGTR